MQQRCCNDEEDLQEAKAKDAGLMTFLGCWYCGVLCYSISPKRQGWLMKMQIGTKRVLNIASSHFHNRVAKSLAQGRCYLKEAVIDGGVPFEKAFGMPVFEYAKKDEKMNNVLNKIMSNISSLVMKKVLATYKGFEGLEQLVDVGGGVRTTLKSIVSKYPQIKGINFDLSRVIRNESPFPGVEYIGGDMFTKVPQGQTIISEWILHNWDDDHCFKLLKNCYDALPKSGKVVVVELFAPESPICPAYNFWVMEFYKNMNPSA
ncbi:hypothetical protein SLEP1_g7405 [Rubroshorea leprosula]|uniref:O-methyltransferase C-terminal domain-containing protein n=1 Tax=Rubroshorea leprosula TaxID=152421 RepID=A0AAV5I6B1_9ROSI|nr:hypothetical protein SLEP1_g7405 [Rubroshorea leprosula]